LVRRATMSSGKLCFTDHIIRKTTTELSLLTSTMEKDLICGRS